MLVQLIKGKGKTFTAAPLVGAQLKATLKLIGAGEKAEAETLQETVGYFKATNFQYMQLYIFFKRSHETNRKEIDWQSRTTYVHELTDS